jgi:hypothetical protein
VECPISTQAAARRILINAPPDSLGHHHKDPFLDQVLHITPTFQVRQFKLVYEKGKGPAGGVHRTRAAKVGARG